MLSAHYIHTTFLIMPVKNIYLHWDIHYILHNYTQTKTTTITKKTTNKANQKNCFSFIFIFFYFIHSFLCSSWSWTCIKWHRRFTSRFIRYPWKRQMLCVYSEIFVWSSRVSDCLWTWFLFWLRKCLGIALILVILIY